MKNLQEEGEETEKFEIDFKLQELNRRNKDNSSSLSSGAEGSDDHILDKEYYEYLQTLGDVDQVVARKYSESDKQSFLQHKNDKEWVKDWYKMVKNLRFKIHYNHFYENMRYNGGLSVWGELKKSLFASKVVKEDENNLESIKDKVLEELSVHSTEKKLEVDDMSEAGSDEPGEGDELLVIPKRSTL